MCAFKGAHAYDIHLFVSQGKVLDYANGAERTVFCCSCRLFIHAA